MTHFPRMINGQLQVKFRENNLRLTDARVLVFRVMSVSEPQTIAEILARCVPAIDRVSVYRTINLFEKLGIAQRLQIGWKYKLELYDEYRTTRTHHHHLTCLHCESIFGVPGDEVLEQRLSVLAKSRNFIMQEHQLEVQGLCATCALKQGIDPFLKT